MLLFQRLEPRALPVCPLGLVFPAVGIHSLRLYGVEEEVRAMTGRAIHWQRNLGDIYLPHPKGTGPRVVENFSLRLAQN